MLLRETIVATNKSNSLQTLVADAHFAYGIIIIIIIIIYIIIIIIIIIHSFTG
jgi:hypothetical protein